jgi:hypothetical protein
MGDAVLKRLLFMLVILALGPPPHRAYAQSHTATNFNWAANYVVVTHRATGVRAQVDTVIMVYAFSPREHPLDAPPTVLPQGGYYILVRNLATGASHYIDFGDAIDFELDLLPGLQSATLRGTASSRRGDATKIDLRWEATGSRERRVFGPDRVGIDDVFYFSRSDFTEREALVSGSVCSPGVVITLDRVSSNARIGTTHQIEVVR